MAAIPSAKHSTETKVDTDQYIVPALRRGMAILRLFKPDRRVIALPEIVRELGMTRATAFRLVYTLEADGYLQRAPHSNAFQLGINLLSLGFEYLGSLDLVEVARPILEDLRDRADASAHLGIQDGREIVYVLKAPSRHRLRSNVTVGTRMPIHTTTIGHALMFDSSLEELRQFFKGVNLRERFAHAPADADALYKELAAQRSMGYVAYRSRFAEGLHSVAAPVRDASGRIVAGVNVSDYESIPAMGELEGAVKDEVLRAAMTISRGLGYRPGAENSLSPPRQA
ncbi:IclR family transcriptional regulator [Polaromonas sp.]|uniref:IclR family transcriptional regulator n=1 Tax=Polaromonas sp. TaxID=1869339 RepID=UPI0017AB207C|nr:IclR family transcriptional regulator [Polaromonas sp.]NMM06464.1 IclR family transcriptional regulator [Polaromonas sp.]